MPDVFAVTIISDLLDYAAAGSLPVTGDAIAVRILYALMGKFPSLAR